MMFKKIKIAFFNFGTIAFLSGCLLFFLQGRGAKQNYGYIDPNIYSGLAFEYKNLVSELGVNYYATRIWHVLPLKVCSDLFGSYGPVAYLMLIAALSSLIAYRLIDQLLSKSSKTLKLGFALFAISVPSYLFDSNWTDEGITYIFASALTLYFASNFLNSKRNSLFFGFMSVVMINIHLKSVALVGALITSMLVVAVLNRGKFLAWVKSVCIGAALGLLVTELIFQILNPRGLWPLSWYYQVSLFLKLSNGIPGEWVSLLQLYRQGDFPTFVLAPLVASLFLMFQLRGQLLRKPRNIPAQVQVLYFFAIFGTFLLFIYQEILKFPVVTTFWYYGTFNVVLLAQLLVITWMYYNNLAVKYQISPVLFWILPVLTLLPVWLVLPGSSLNIGREFHNRLLTFACLNFLLILMLILIFEAKLRKALNFCVICIFCFVSISQFGSKTTPLRWRDIGDFKVETKLFSDERWLLNIWSDLEERNFEKDVAIWYENDPDGLLGSVQSSVVFADTRLTLNNTLTESSLREWELSNGMLKAVIYMFVYQEGDNIEGSKDSIDYFASRGCEARVTTAGRPPYRDIEKSPSGEIALLKLFCN